MLLRGAGAEASRSAGEEAFIASGDGSLGGSDGRPAAEMEVQVEPWLLHGRMDRRYRTRAVHRRNPMLRPLKSAVCRCDTVR